MHSASKRFHQGTDFLVVSIDEGDDCGSGRLKGAKLPSGVHLIPIASCIMGWRMRCQL